MMAGLPEINLSDSMPSVSLQEVREQCEEVLNKADKQLLYYYYLHWDCQNIVKLLNTCHTESQCQVRVKLHGVFPSWRG